MNNAVKAQVDILRQRTISILEDLAEKTSQFDLPKLPQGLAEYQKKFATNTYSVLIVGEAKRGKSSFVNALIGRDLLPTDVKIATNQVFRVSQAEQEAYRLRFEDETAQEINAAELLEYGSQAVADQKGVTRFNFDQLRWIEVDVPVIRFVPPGVSLMDTPGMGSLYAPHAQITQRFVPYADAVIFVLDSSPPATQLELEFLEKILEFTRHIFFIQTKIDAYNKEDWQWVQQRNEEILREHFKDRLADTRVWPISSHNLMKAWQASNPAGLLKVSRQPDLADALEKFLFRVAGWNRCRDALVIADHYYTASRKTLAGRLAGLEAKSTQELSEMQQRGAQSKQQLEDDWGPRGKKRRELQLKVQKIANAGKQSMTELLASGGELEMTRRCEIDAVKSIDEANKLGATISEQVVTKVTSKWRSVCDQSRRQCSLLLGSLVEDADALILPPEDPNLPLRIGAAVEVKNDLWGNVDEALKDFQNAGNAAWAAAIIVSVFVPTLTVGAALIGVAVAGIWGAARGISIAKGSHLKEAQQKLHEHLSTVMEEVRKHLLLSNSMYDGQSLVNHHFDGLVQAIGGQIEDIVEEKFKQAQKESARLDEQVKLDGQQRKVKTEELQQQLAEWDELGHSIRATNTELEALEISLAASVASSV